MPIYGLYLHFLHVLLHVFIYLLIQRNADGIDSAPSKVPFSVCKVPFSVCKVPFSVCKVPLSVCKVQFSVCKVPFSVCKVPFSVCKVPFSVCQVPFSVCIPMQTLGSQWCCKYSLHCECSTETYLQFLLLEEHWLYYNVAYYMVSGLAMY